MQTSLAAGTRENQHNAANAVAVDPVTVLTGDCRFYCNICLDPVHEPVVTVCGHLYCWPCLYQWLEPGMTAAEQHALFQQQQQQHGAAPSAATARPLNFMPNSARRVCPVCKAACSVTNVVPIYVRTDPPTRRTNTTTGNKSSNNNNNLHASEPPNIPEDKDSVRQQEQQSKESESGSTEAEAANAAAYQSPDNEEEFKIDDDENNEIVNPENQQQQQQQPAEEELDVGLSSTRGLRQRLRFRSQDSEISAPPNHNEEDDEVQVENQDSNIQTSHSIPARPPATAVYLQQQQQPAAQNQANQQALVLLNHHNNTHMLHRASLVHGIALQLQQAVLDDRRQQQQQQQLSGNASGEQPEQSFIPPVHRQDGGFGNAAAAAATNWQQQQQHLPTATTDPDATEFLSRILLMLGSFVILCLLLF